MKAPDYLTHFPGLMVRKGDRLVSAPEEDLALARGYPQSTDKGPLKDGVRLTLLTQKRDVMVGEPVRILHVVEVSLPGRSVYVMGPKAILGEYVDGSLKTPPAPAQEDPLAPPGVYDGRVQPSPAVDYNHDITTYSFSTPGPHQIYWKLGPFQSNVLTFQVRARHTESR